MNATSTFEPVDLSIVPPGAPDCGPPLMTMLPDGRVSITRYLVVIVEDFGDYGEVCLSLSPYMLTLAMAERALEAQRTSYPRCQLVADELVLDLADDAQRARFLRILRQADGERVRALQ
jgi:hypothetical protein